MRSFFYIIMGVVMAMQTSVLVSCSDDSDKLEEFNETKIQRIKKSISNELELVEKVSSDGVIFLSPDVLRNYHIQVKLSNNRNFSYSSYSDVNFTYNLYSSETISGLSPNTTYYYQYIIKESYYGDVFMESPVYSFTTKKLNEELPQVNKIYCDAISFTQPSGNIGDAKISIAQSPSDLPSNPEKKISLNNHSWVCSGLKPNTYYYYVISVQRKSFPVLDSGVQNFRTASYSISKPVIDHAIYSRESNFNFAIQIQNPICTGEFFGRPDNFSLTIYYSSSSTYPTTELYSGYLEDKYNSTGQSVTADDSHYTFWDRDIYLSYNKTYYFRIVVDGVSSDVISYKPIKL